MVTPLQGRFWKGWRGIATALLLAFFVVSVPGPATLEVSLAGWVLGLGLSAAAPVLVLWGVRTLVARTADIVTRKRQTT